jgi:hypothetical protein
VILLLLNAPDVAFAGRRKLKFCGYQIDTSHIRLWREIAVLGMVAVRPFPATNRDIRLGMSARTVAHDRSWSKNGRWVGVGERGKSTQGGH